MAEAAVPPGRRWQLLGAGLLGSGGAVLAIGVSVLAAVARAEVAGAGTQADLMTARGAFDSWVGVLPGVAGAALLLGSGLLGLRGRGAVRASRWWTVWRVLAIGVVAAAGFATWVWVRPLFDGATGPHYLTPFYGPLVPPARAEVDAALAAVARRAEPWDQPLVAVVLGVFAVVHARVTALVLSWDLRD